MTQLERLQEQLKIALSLRKKLVKSGDNPLDVLDDWIEGLETSIRAEERKDGA